MSFLVRQSWKLLPLAETILIFCRGVTILHVQQNLCKMATLWTWESQWNSLFFLNRGGLPMQVCSTQVSLYYRVFQVAFSIQYRNAKLQIITWLEFTNRSQDVMWNLDSISGFNRVIVFSFSFCILDRPNNLKNTSNKDRTSARGV